MRVGDPRLPSTTFVGRHRLILEARDRLATHRLVTLLGMGGVGKSRLAQRILTVIKRDITACWVQLVDIPPGADIETLIHAVARACGLSNLGSHAPWEALVEHLGAHRHLLVLDNAEHLIEPLGALVSQLAAAVPTIQILTTSRQPLGCHGEQRLTVPPLTPADGWTLLVDRAAALDITVDAQYQSVGEQLSQRLDGIPLAIELAAVRLQAMCPEELLAAADDRLRLLTGGSRHGGHPTHTSLRAMVAWSWDLCTPTEQALWARCSIFPTTAGWDLAAASHICANGIVHNGTTGGETVASLDVLPLLDGLTDKHIVTADTNRRNRYRLTETLRLFGQEMLAQRGEHAAIANRHADYYRRRTEHVMRTWSPPDDSDWMSWADTNLANLRKAFQTTVTHPDHVMDAVTFATDLARLSTWVFTGSPQEGLQWLQQALADATTALPNPNDEQTQQLVAGHAMAGWIAVYQGDTAEPALAACHALLAGRPAQPMASFLQGADLLLAHADPHAIPLLTRAREGFTTASPHFRRDVIRTALVEAWATACVGTTEAALEVTDRCLHDLASAGEASTFLFWARLFRAIALLRHHQHDQALPLAREALSWGSTRDDRCTVWAIHVIAWTMSEQLTSHTTPTDTATTTAYLLGGAECYRRRTGLTLTNMAPLAAPTTRAEAATQAALDPTAYASAYSRGASADLADICAVALGDNHRERSSLAPSHPEPWDVLTSAERDVARLAADGMSNADIARHRGVSVRTIETQMTAALRGLGLTNRHQITTMIPADVRDATDGHMTDTSGEQGGPAAATRPGHTPATRP